MSTKRYLAPWRRAAIRMMEPGEDGRAVLAALEGKPALYHCISRAVWQEMVFGEAEKERFVAIMRKWESFSQVRVLTFCVMTNHFHILVEVPERPAQDPKDEELLEHLAKIYRGQRLAEIRWELENMRRQGNHSAAEALRQRFLRRMWDLSVFMKAVKQEFTVWWNKKHAKRGNLWEDKFKSVLVEDGHAVRMVAGYIELNPVRAGIAKSPEDYRWSGWGEAVAGKKQARQGIRQVMLERELGLSNPATAIKDVAEWRKVAAEYRALMQQDASRRKTGQETSGAGSTGDRRARARMAEPLMGGGHGVLSEGELLVRRVRYFADGLVIGSRRFVDGVFDLTRDWFGAKRTSGARRMAHASTSLRTMRALRVKPIG